MAWTKTLFLMAASSIMQVVWSKSEIYCCSKASVADECYRFSINIAELVLIYWTQYGYFRISYCICNWIAHGRLYLSQYWNFYLRCMDIPVKRSSFVYWRDNYCDSLLAFLQIKPLQEAGLGGSVRCASDWWSGGCGFDIRRVGNIHSFRFDHESFSPIILSLSLIQEKTCTLLVKRLEESVVR